MKIFLLQTRRNLTSNRQEFVTKSLLEEFDTCNPTKEQWDEFVKIGKKYEDMGKSFEDENGNTIQHITEVVYNQANTPNWDALEEEK